MDSPDSGPGNDGDHGATAAGAPAEEPAAGAPEVPAPGATAPESPAAPEVPAPEAPGAPQVPAAVLRSWDQAEARLFPLVMARPDAYERALHMIADLAARLRDTCPDVPALLAAHERGADLVTEESPGVGPELVAAAACAMRYREIVTTGAARRRLAALARARDQGLEWAVVEENGDPARAPYIPYQRVEAHVRSGRAVIVSVEPDETLTGAVHRLDAADLDLATGGLRTGAALGSYGDGEALAQALHQARHGIPADWQPDQP
jgi:hypothetical protein